MRECRGIADDERRATAQNAASRRRFYLDCALPVLLPHCISLITTVTGRQGSVSQVRDAFPDAGLLLLNHEEIEARIVHPLADGIIRAIEHVLGDSSRVSGSGTLGHE